MVQTIHLLVVGGGVVVPGSVETPFDATDELTVVVVVLGAIEVSEGEIELTYSIIKVIY